MLKQQVILVDESDRVTGAMDKMQAHREGCLHRAFSVFIFNSDGEMLLQQRADEKYHSPGLWSNACCSHPAPGENTKDAALRRLQEELGFVTEIDELFSFTYRTELANGLVENEYDHVLAGIYSGNIRPNHSEVKDICYRSVGDIEVALKKEPQQYTAWFQIVFPRIKRWSVNRFGTTNSILQ